MLIPLTDSLADQSTADSRIGDSPDDVISVSTYRCATGHYMRRMIDPELCWEVDVRRPVLEMP